MKRLDVRTHTAPWTIGRWLIGIGVVVVFCMSWFAAVMTAQTRALRDEISALHQQQRWVGSASASTADPGRSRSDRRFFLAAGELRMPWDELFVALEHSYLPEVNLLSIEPDGDSGTLKITAQAPRLDDALSFVGRLGNRPMLSGTVLTSHEKRLLADTQIEGIHFVVTTTWARM